MVKHRYLVSFFSTTLFYLLLAGAYFYAQNQYLIANQKPQDQVMHLSLANYVEEVEPPVEEPEEIEQEESLVEEEVIEEPEPEPIIEEKLLPEVIIPKPIVEPKITPEPVVKKVLKKPVVKKKKVQKKKTKKKVQKKASKQTTRGAKRTGTAKKNDTAKKNRFLSQVRQRINKHKSYPKMAKRRGVQGKVKIRFTILANGHVGHISIKGPKIFHSSARRAVKGAFPVNRKNVPFSLPKSVNLTLHYQLR